MQLFTALLSALALAASATALPAPAAIRRSENIVISPPIFSPRAGDIWPINSVQTVEWDTTMFTGSAQNNSGTILLGYNDGTESENLDSSKSFGPPPHAPPLGMVLSYAHAVFLA